MPSIYRRARLLALTLSLAACVNDDSPDDDQRGSSAATQEAGDESLEPGRDAATEGDSVTDVSNEDDAGTSIAESQADAEVESPTTPAVCELPFASGSCLAYFEVWTYASSRRACVRGVYGGCGGNENRFATRAECEETCGVPETGPTNCPANTKRAEVCLACGLAGGCAETAVVCALKCDEPNDCKGGNEYPTTCVDGICQVYGCI